MFSLRFRNEYPEPIARELLQFFADLEGVLLREHSADGTHSFPDYTEGTHTYEDAIEQIIDRYQAKGQFWKYGAWLFNDASDPRAGRAWLRPPDPAAGTYHNYAPTGIDRAVVLELEPTGNITITGIKAREGLDENRLLILRNRDSMFSITIPHESTSSLAHNRFDLPGNVTLTLGPRETSWFLYDTGRERWGAIITGTQTGGIMPGAGVASVLDAAMEITIDGGGAVITTGAKKFYGRVPYTFTPTAVELVADQSGSIVIDIWKDTYANFPPTVADTVTASAKPTLSSAQKSQDTTLSGWNTTWAEGDRIEVNVDSASTVTKVVMTVYGTRSS